MKQNHTYIIKEAYSFNEQLCFKVTIQELTSTSVLVKWENGEIVRYHIPEFERRYIILEEIIQKTEDIYLEEVNF